MTVKEMIELLEFWNPKLHLMVHNADGVVGKVTGFSTSEPGEVYVDYIAPDDVQKKEGGEAGNK